MHRTYAENLDLSPEIIILTDKEEIHHLRDVLRMRAGETLKIFNGLGNEATGEIITLSKKEAQIKIISREKILENLNKPYLILACAIPKKDKLEWIIEKATELGVSEIIPLKTQRTEFKITPERCQKKEGRYKTTAINAAKQCQRLTVPKIHPITNFTECLKNIPDDVRILLPCLIGNRIPLKEALLRSKNKKIMLIIGPEGDFTEEEVHSTLSTGAMAVSLGETTLKVETAAIASVAASKLFFVGEH